jgi:hypothetical protein
LTLRVNQSLANTSTSVNYRSARPPRLIQIVAPFSSRLSRNRTAYPFDLPHLRALLISSADIGELMMRAFILRRAALLEGDSVGSVILGEAGSVDTVRLRGLLSR